MLVFNLSDLNITSASLTPQLSLIRRLRVTQRAMVRAMLGVSLRDRISNVEIRRRTRVTDIAQRVAKLKWQRGPGTKFGERMDVGVPRCWNGCPELVSAALVDPQQRWTDDIKRDAGFRWIQAAQNRGIWNSLQKTYVQQLTSIG
ncbi:jg21633 [Pararge aegeria aegeria]|uniref:Jg21633 protein n=1 Tax=Pararge aegeria aegeria TaxID=348720 RepID=A0A8S4QVW2_9NEOP|nr:jg21633 [Pararge aegeria aegeria]